MRPDGERKKKLIVAFHFVIANGRSRRAGWDCESCRRHGLEAVRRCGFLPEAKRADRRIVWGRGQVRVDECPKSFVTGDSLALVEEFLVRRRLGLRESLDLEARKVDAFLILRDETEREERDGEAEH